MMVRHLSMAELQERLAESGPSPADKGRLEMIVSRPDTDERLVLDQGELNPAEGLKGDNWRTRGSRSTADGSSHPDMQITLMNSRIIQAMTQDRAHWPLAGDQLFVDLDLGTANLPPGQRLGIGAAVLEITDVPHTGCAKFTERFGHDAIRFVNSAEGREQRRRGVYARVVQSGVITTGDMVYKIDVTRSQADELLAFLPLFEDPDRSFVEHWAGGERTASGAITMPYPVYKPDVLAFFSLTRQSQWIDYEYQLAKAVPLLEDDDFIAGCSLADFKALLTCCVRSERFGDGNWEGLLQSGKITALLRRLAELRNGLPPDLAGSPANPVP